MHDRRAFFQNMPMTALDQEPDTSDIWPGGPISLKFGVQNREAVSASSPTLLKATLGNAYRRLLWQARQFVRRLALSVPHAAHLRYIARAKKCVTA
ncbi:MAG TPA: hypothetical protein VEM96_09210 [Pyrinomonadaceae bacterium]|nr:hypothetical protein [Pyrinomonadaceae bacterium]